MGTGQPLLMEILRESGNPKLSECPEGLSFDFVHAEMIRCPNQESTSARCLQPRGLHTRLVGSIQYAEKFPRIY